MNEGSPLVIAGLGNPGREYERTRHNFGFMLLDELYREGSFSSWKVKDGAEVSKGELFSRETFLIKPLTYMNRSGEPLSRVMHFYKCEITSLLVLHDELDLTFGELRFKRGGGEGGHNGLKSISNCVGSKEYWRLRLGIGKPSAGKEVMVGWVLSSFSKEEGIKLPQLLHEGVQAVGDGIKRGFIAAQCSLNSQKALNSQRPLGEKD